MQSPSSSSSTASSEGATAASDDYYCSSSSTSSLSTGPLSIIDVTMDMRESYVHMIERKNNLFVESSGIMIIIVIIILIITEGEAQQ